MYFVKYVEKSYHGKGRHISLKKHVDSIHIREFSFKWVGCAKKFSGTAKSRLIRK